MRKLAPSYKVVSVTNDPLVLPWVHPLAVAATIINTNTNNLVFIFIPPLF